MTNPFLRDTTEQEPQQERSNPFLRAAPTQESQQERSNPFLGTTPSVEEDVFTQPSPEDQALLDKEMPKAFQDRTYTPSELVSDPEALRSIRQYMYRFHGTPSDVSDEEVVDNYLANMRKFAAGQSVVTVNELLSLKQADKEDLTIAGQAYDLFDRLEGVFSEDYTWGETFEGLGSYARAVIVDPTNLIGLGIGRAVAGSGTKAAAFALKQVAKEAAEQTMKKTLTQQLGKKGAARVLTEGATKAAEKKALGAATQAARVAERQALQKAAKSSAMSTALKKQAGKEIAVATGVDTALALGVDLAYQNGMIMTGQQEEYSPFQSGLTALGVLGGGMLTGAVQLSNKSIAKQSEGILESFKEYDFVKGPAKEAAKKVSQPEMFDQIMSNMTEWSKRVSEGRTLTKEGDLVRGVDEQNFFRTFILGDEELGVKGVAQTMIEAGVTPPSPRYAGDNITAFIADTLDSLPKEQKDVFLKTFRDNVGTHLPDYKDASMKDVANLFSYQMHTSAQTLNMSSQVSKMFKAANVGEDLTIGNALDLLNPSTGRMKIMARELKDEPRTLDFYQNNLIQFIVTHPGTTALNIKGSLARGVYDTASDMVQASLYTALGTRGLVTGDFSDVKRGVKMMKAAKGRVERLMAPDATADEAMDYLSLRPEVEKTLFRFLSGGVENEDLLKTFNMDKTSKLAQSIAKGTTNTKDFMQKLYLVQAQDKYFKTQNFMYYLDKQLAVNYGTNYSDFVKRTDVAEIMDTPEYAALEMKAVEDTLLSVFSKSYSSRETIKQNPIHSLATIIEDVRKIPIVGAALPFGQFFNNTIDMMADYSGAKFAYRFAGFGEGRTQEALTESAAKAAVGWTAIYHLSKQEEENIDRGLGWKETIDTDGTIVSKEYDFPESYFKMLARMMAHDRRDGSVPNELLTQFATTFGPEAFTRNIQGTGQEISNTIKLFGEGDAVEAIKEFSATVGNEIGSAWVSGYMRPLDPVNQLAGLLKEEGPTVIDRKQGYKILNNSFRYVDQIFDDMLISLGSEEKKFATTERPQTEIGKLFGYRTVPAQSNTQRMFNAIEMPEWKAGTSTGNEKLDNRLNELIFPYVERQATLLVNNPRWDKLSVDIKRKSAQAALNLARKQARKSLSLSPIVEDDKLAAIDEVIRKAGSQRELKRAMKYLEMDKDLDEYNSSQIRSVLNAIEAIKDEDEVAPFR